jgi:hypothetical protein
VEEIIGGLLTVIFILDVATFPAASFATAEIVCRPFETVFELHIIE